MMKVKIIFPYFSQNTQKQKSTVVDEEWEDIAKNRMIWIACRIKVQRMYIKKDWISNCNTELTGKAEHYRKFIITPFKVLNKQLKKYW